MTGEELESDDSNYENLKTCPYCLALIPKDAVKCSHCSEWVVNKKKSEIKDTIEDATLQSTLKVAIKEAIDSIKNFDFWS